MSVGVQEKLLKKLKQRFYMPSPKDREEFWQRQHEQKGSTWLESYWQDSKLRHLLADRIMEQEDVSSVFEAGCNTGANLRQISEAAEKLNRNVRLLGWDINEAAVKYGSERLPHAELICRSLYNLDDLDTNSVDVAFSSAVLMHLPNDRIKEVVSNMVRIARSRVVLMELHAEAPWEIKYFDSLNRRKFRDRWVRDYRSLLKDCGCSDIRVERVDHNVAAEKDGYSAIKTDVTAITVGHCKTNI